jgi:hypothetical protein
MIARQIGPVPEELKVCGDMAELSALPIQTPTARSGV